MWKQEDGEGRARTERKKRNLLKGLGTVKKIHLELGFSAHSCRPFQVKGENFLLEKAFQDLSSIQLIRYMI